MKIKISNYQLSPILESNNYLHLLRLLVSIVGFANHVNYEKMKNIYILFENPVCSIFTIYI